MSRLLHPLTKSVFGPPQEEPFWEESHQFTPGMALQREVEVEVETIDRGGTFLGALHVLGGPKCVALGCRTVPAAAVLAQQTSLQQTLLLPCPCFCHVPLPATCEALLLSQPLS